MWRRLIRHRYLLMLLPAIGLYTLFIVYPFGVSMFYSLTDWSGVGAYHFIGFTNYSKILFTQPFQGIFLNALGHNFFYFLMSTVTSVIFGMFVAIVLENTKFSKIYRIIYFLPIVMAIIAVGFLWNLLLNPNWGVINQFLNAIGLSTLALPWLGSMKLALPIIILVDSWRSAGFSIVVFSAALSYIPRELIEAAHMDGAKRFDVITKITLPLLLPTFFTVMTLNFIWSFGVFDIIMALESIGGGPYYSTDTLALFFYRSSFGYTGHSSMGFGFGASIATLTFFVILIVTLVLLMVRRRIESRLF